MQKNQFTIASFYKFKKIANPQKLQNLLKEFCQFNKLKGTILIAQEGINANVSGFDTINGGSLIGITVIIKS